MLSRNVEIKSSSLTVRIAAVHRKGDEPEIESQTWLELKGVLTEPVKNVRDVVISLYPKDKMEVGTARPASCGAIIRARPELQFVITWPQHEFDRLWSMVGQPPHARAFLFHKVSLQHWPGCERIVFKRAGGVITAARVGGESVGEETI